jgi:uncharacterized membrane protein (DUF2068 family)
MTQEDGRTGTMTRLTANRPVGTSGHEPAHAAGSPRAMRTIAVFEGLKGVLVIAATLGLFSLLHRDLHTLAAALIGHFGLSPGDHYPALLLRYADLIEDANRRTLALLAVAYVGVRFSEAYGLWHARIWGQWLAALSGALYVPFEAHHLIYRPTVASAAVLLANLAIVAYLALQLWRERRTGPATARDA